MHIKDVEFFLDRACIGNISASKNTIELPYTGSLPDDFSDVSDAKLRFVVNPENCTVVLETRSGTKKRRHLVDATVQEVSSILWAFFFEPQNGSSDQTRFSNGLSEYWTGYLQANFINWKNVALRPRNIIKILEAMPQEDRLTIIQYIEEYKKEDWI